MQFEITENDENVVVKVTIPERKLASEPVMFCDTETVINRVKKDKIEVGIVLTSKFLVLRNSSSNKPLTGVWKFAKLRKSVNKAKEKNEPTKRTRTRKPRKQS